MRILVDYRPALSERTGVGEYVHQTVRAMLAEPAGDRAISLFSASWKHRLGSNHIPGADVVDRKIPGRLLHLLWHRLEWPPVEALARTDFDIVQSAHPLLIPTRRAAQVVTIYDLDFLDHPERTVREIRRDYPALAGPHARRADQVIVISAHTAREVERRLGVPAAHISICVPGAPPWRPRTGEPASGGCILFLGTLEPRKNLDVLVEAYERLVSSRPDAPPLVLAGRASSDAGAILERVRRPPLAGRVETPGYVDAGAREALYHRALVFVMPSHTEGFGLPAVEAMMAGVPVIAANRGALTESVGAGGLLVDPTDSAGLARVLGTLLDDPGRRRAMAEAGRRHAERFTWAATAEAMRGAWSLALEHRAQRGR
jgi:glycosyltransferase involved in cell wall biosynthesis